MASFNDFLNALKDGLKQVVAQSLADYKDAAVQDGEAFLIKTRADLERWTAELAQGRLSRDDFEWLVRGKKDLGGMEALKQAGLPRAARSIPDLDHQSRDRHRFQGVSVSHVLGFAALRQESVCPIRRRSSPRWLLSVLPPRPSWST